MNFNYFEVHLTEHCNLNCQSCDNFSPLAEAQFVSRESFALDLFRLRHLAKDSIKLIRLLGGEPLLHPDAIELCEIARAYFSDSEIRLTTNGILLNQMSDKFWTSCKDNNITIEITFYPINIGYDKIKEKAEKFDVKVIPFGNIEKPEKFSYRNPINTKGDQNIEENWSKCYQVGSCTSLKDGKLYPCSCVPNICHFNKFFGKSIPVTTKDYIDIYEIESKEQIEEFLDTPIPFCAYCNVNNRTRGKKWDVTKKDIKEWLDD